MREHHPSERKQAKIIQFELINGASPSRIAAELHVRREDAVSLINNYFKHYAGVKQYFNQSHERLLSDGYLDDVFGRRRWFPGLLTATDGREVEKAKRSGQNHLIQAAAATITKLAMIRCHRHITANYPGIKMILTLHDELHFEVPLDIVDSFAKELPDLMCSLGLERFGFEVPMRVEVKVGQNWADLKPYNGGQS